MSTTSSPLLVKSDPRLLPSPFTSQFVSKRESELQEDGRRRDERPTTDDFLKRLNAVEENPAAAKLVMPLVSTRGCAQNFQPATGTDHVAPSTLESLQEESAGATAADATKKKHEVPRHRRVYKEVGATLGLTLIDHPVHPGVVVKALATDGACAQHGVRVGDHVIKVNGNKPEDHTDAMRMIDHAWSSAPEDGSKDRLKFSLADRTQDIVLNRAGPSAEAPPRAAAGRGEPTDVGLQLIDNTTAGLGLVVLHVVDGLPAALAGLEVGHVIQSVDGELSWDHKSGLKRISSQFAANGEVTLVVQMRKLTEGNVLNQRVGEMPVNIVVTE